MSLEDAAEMVKLEVDYWFHGHQAPHVWTYRGKDAGYRCQICGLEVSKAELKAATDA